MAHLSSARALILDCLFAWISIGMAQTSKEDATKSPITVNLLDGSIRGATDFPEDVILQVTNNQDFTISVLNIKSNQSEAVSFDVFELGAENSDVNSFNTANQPPKNFEVLPKSTKEFRLKPIFTETARFLNSVVITVKVQVPKVAATSKTPSTGTSDSIQTSASESQNYTFSKSVKIEEAKINYPTLSPSIEANTVVDELNPGTLTVAFLNNSPKSQYLTNFAITSTSNSVIICTVGVDPQRCSDGKNPTLNLPFSDSITPEGKELSSGVPFTQTFELKTRVTQPGTYKVLMGADYVLQSGRKYHNTGSANVTVATVISRVFAGNEYLKSAFLLLAPGVFLIWMLGLFKLQLVPKTAETTTPIPLLPDIKIDLSSLGMLMISFILSLALIAFLSVLLGHNLLLGYSSLDFIYLLILALIIAIAVFIIEKWRQFLVEKAKRAAEAELTRTNQELSQIFAGHPSPAEILEELKKRNGKLVGAIIQPDPTTQNFGFLTNILGPEGTIWCLPVMGFKIDDKKHQELATSSQPNEANLLDDLKRAKENFTDPLFVENFIKLALQVNSPITVEILPNSIQNPTTLKSPFVYGNPPLVVVQNEAPILKFQ